MNSFLSRRVNRLIVGSMVISHFTTLYRSFFGVILLALISNQSYGQIENGSSSFGKAAVSNEYVITLDTDSDLQSIYKADISELSFESQAQASEIFSQLNDSGITVAVLWSEKKVEILINPDPLHENWTVSDWNKLLEKNAKRIK